MKKILLIGLCVFILSSLCGCGGNMQSEEMTEPERIEQEIRSQEEEYATAKIESITVNEHSGTETADDYIVLIDMALDPMEKEKGSGIMETVSDDIVANLHEKGYANVSEVAVSWKDEKNGRIGKFAYFHRENGFENVQAIILSKPN